MTATSETSQTTGDAVQSFDLKRLIYNRRWARRAQPFPHVVAQDVFVPEFYGKLEADFRRIESERAAAFERNIHGYDATHADLANDHDGALGVFVSREWHDLIAGLMGIECTGDVLATLHHHDPGSKTGWPHNDLSPAWFQDPPPGPGEIRLNTDARINYGTGPTAPDVPAHETIRAISILFYLNNGAWQPGDGGETALFASQSQAQTVGPAATVPPLDNSMVIFECTPFSWHTFLSNRVKSRDSVVMWLHRDKAEVVARWGDHSIDYWA